MNPGGRVAILGRPNVGKSTLFNALTRSRKALVKNEPGVTRDVLEEIADWWGHTFTLLDTGGLTDSSDGLAKGIKRQVNSILSSVDLLLLVFDAKAGPVPEDQDIVRLAQQTGKPFFAVINKVDRLDHGERYQLDFAELGVDVHPASFEQREGLPEIVEWIIAHLPQEEPRAREGLRLAVMGKPNVGKSSLCNRLLGHARHLVSPIAGTTTDTVESEFEFGSQKYRLMDTAGLRRSARRQSGLEGLAALKSEQALDKADIVLLMVDMMEGPSEQDARLLHAIHENATPTIMVANKIDLAGADKTRLKDAFRDKLKFTFHFIDDLPLVFTSAETGSGLNELFRVIEQIWRKMHMRIPTSQLNRFFQKSIRSAPSPVYGSANVKFYYLTQTKQVPPAFIAFANHPEGVTPSYRRFLIHRLKAEFQLEGVPIRIFCMKSGRDLESHEARA
jgi:GTP-binding protein